MTDREREVRKDIRMIIATHGKEDFPLWELMSIMNEYPELDWKKIRKYYNI